MEQEPDRRWVRTADEVLSGAPVKYGIACVILALGVSALALGGQDKSITLPDDNAMAQLKPGPGVEAVRANCVACHSTDYIVRQPPSQAKAWEAEVKKMMAVFGAPIDEGDARTIVDYLSSAYGPQAQGTPGVRAPKGRTSSKPQGTKNAADH